jgi:hypothetical protein
MRNGGRSLRSERPLLSAVRDSRIARCLGWTGRWIGRQPKELTDIRTAVAIDIVVVVARVVAVIGAIKAGIVSMEELKTSGSIDSAGTALDG